MIEFGSNKEEAEKLFKELGEEEIEVNIKTIDINKIKDYVLSPNVMKPLLDVVFTGTISDSEE